MCSKFAVDLTLHYMAITLSFFPQKDFSKKRRYDFFIVFNFSGKAQNNSEFNLC